MVLLHVKQGVMVRAGGVGYKGEQVVSCMVSDHHMQSIQDKGAKAGGRIGFGANSIMHRGDTIAIRILICTSVG